MARIISNPLYLFALMMLLPVWAGASLSVLACEPEWAALIQALGGDRVRVFSATTHLQDPHHIQARPSLIAKARRADLLVCSGAELEIGWLPVLLKKSGNGNIQQGQPGYFMATEYVPLLEVHNHVDRSMGDVHAAGNPHIHQDPDRVLQVAEQLSGRLQQLDVEHADDYQRAFEQFKRQWQERSDYWLQQAAQLNGREIIVNHNAWVYLEDWLGLKRIASLEPKPGVPPTVSHLSSVLESVATKQGVMVLTADYQDDQAVKWLLNHGQFDLRVLPFTVKKNETIHEWRDRLMQTLLNLPQ